MPEKIKDDQQLRNMSGQWFYEAKAKRHRDKIHGADIIRASMRKKRHQGAGELIGLVHLEPAFVWEKESLGERKGVRIVTEICSGKSLRGVLCIMYSSLGRNLLALGLDG